MVKFRPLKDLNYAETFERKDDTARLVEGSRERLSGFRYYAREGEELRREWELTGGGLYIFLTYTCLSSWHILVYIYIYM